MVKAAAVVAGAMTEPADDGGTSTDDRKSARRRLARLLPDATTLSMLGLISIPGFVSDEYADLRVFAVCFLFAYWPLVRVLKPKPPTAAEEDPVGWIELGGRPRQFVLSTLLVQFNPFVAWQSLKQLGGQVGVSLRYRGNPPSPETWHSDVSYRLPVEGEWTVVNGSHEREHSHSWELVTQRYA